MKPLVIYHADCVDGFTAAWVASKDAAWADASFLAEHYGNEPPLAMGRDVLIVDFSYPCEQLLRMHAEANSLLVLDHHKTAQEDLEGLNFARFDMNRSGAGLTWDVLHWGAERPQLIDYVEDRDLWRWKLPDSRAVSAFVGSFERSFEQWDEIAKRLDDLLQFGVCVSEGKAILRSLDRHVEMMCSRHGWVELAGQVVPCINTTSCTSEIVGRLAEQHPFAVGWFQRSDGLFIYSLRSRGDGADVSAIARSMGGGGHRGAAGFTSTTQLPIYAREK